MQVNFPSNPKVKNSTKNLRGYSAPFDLNSTTRLGANRRSISNRKWKIKDYEVECLNGEVGLQRTETGDTSGENSAARKQFESRRRLKIEKVDAVLEAQSPNTGQKIFKNEEGTRERGVRERTRRESGRNRGRYGVRGQSWESKEIDAAGLDPQHFNSLYRVRRRGPVESFVSGNIDKLESIGSRQDLGVESRPEQRPRLSHGDWRASSLKTSRFGPTYKHLVSRVETMIRRENEGRKYSKTGLDNFQGLARGGVGVYRPSRFGREEGGQEQMSVDPTQHSHLSRDLGSRNTQSLLISSSRTIRDCSSLQVLRHPSGPINSSFSSGLRPPNQKSREISNYLKAAPIILNRGQNVTKSHLNCLGNERVKISIRPAEPTKPRPSIGLRRRGSLSKGLLPRLREIKMRHSNPDNFMTESILSDLKKVKTVGVASRDHVALPRHRELKAMNFPRKKQLQIVQNNNSFFNNNYSKFLNPQKSGEWTEAHADVEEHSIFAPKEREEFSHLESHLPPVFMKSQSNFQETKECKIEKRGHAERGTQNSFQTDSKTGQERRTVTGMGLPISICTLGTPKLTEPYIGLTKQESNSNISNSEIKEGKRFNFQRLSRFSGLEDGTIPHLSEINEDTFDSDSEGEFWKFVENKKSGVPKNNENFENLETTKRKILNDEAVSSIRQRGSNMAEKSSISAIKKKESAQNRINLRMALNSLSTFFDVKFRQNKREGLNILFGRFFREHFIKILNEFNKFGTTGGSGEIVENRLKLKFQTGNEPKMTRMGARDALDMSSLLNSRNQKVLKNTYVRSRKMLGKRSDFCIDSKVGREKIENIGVGLSSSVKNSLVENSDIDLNILTTKKRNPNENFQKLNKTLKQSSKNLKKKMVESGCNSLSQRMVPLCYSEPNMRRSARLKKNFQESEKRRLKALEADSSETEQVPRPKTRAKRDRSRKPLVLTKNDPNKIEGVNCNCKRTKCLKMYCKCFAVQGFCSGACGCTDCCNQLDNPLRHLAQKEVLAKNPKAFFKKFKRVKSSSDSVGFLHSRGCKCRKTKCLKNYCECYSVGVACSVLCQCQGCQNDKLQMSKEEANKYFEKRERRRHKSVLMYKYFVDTFRVASGSELRVKIERLYSEGQGKLLEELMQTQDLKRIGELMEGVGIRKKYETDRASRQGRCEVLK